ncbi:rifin PIR protein, putative [Plasmodium reichenowi]|uniref:Rifin PIR protein, putative n=1 Tax=Plasmodium reichenowi TaxID=5854 RepID=A0A2P9D3Y4_PLARE|nr:rifin PIR protein, putative [Plasmodium reichenowi]
MKLQYFKILLFFILLNILANTHKKPSITASHIPRYTSRVLSECDTESSIYDKDEEMKSVKERFDDRTSQRFQEYEERMKDKRQRRKEERDKNIQTIIEKDKMDKSLAEKVEIGCLRCGCGLGGVAAGVGIFGAVSVNELTKAALLAVSQKGIEAGIEAGVKAAIAEIKRTEAFKSIWTIEWSNFIDGSNYNSIPRLVDAVKAAINSTTNKCPNRGGPMDRVCNAITTNSNYFVRSVAKAGEKAAVAETARFEEAEIALVNDTSTYLYNAIGYSVLAILIIVLVMLIIYLVLRYRRKKKMNKKAHYTILLNQ